MARLAPSDMVDWLVVTASSRSQAAGYRAVLGELRAAGRLKSVRQRLVVPDPKDRRAGSGNATLIAIARMLAARLAQFRRARRGRASMDDLFADQRVLIIHSGGDSRRLPAYAASGKLFLPLACRNPDDTRATMFDLILADLSRVLLSVPMPGATLVASGDVLLNASSHPIDLSSPGITGVAFPASPEVASRHGVYACDAQGRVREFLQKPTRAELTASRATRPDGTALVDSGIVSIDHAAMARLMHASGISIDHKQGRVCFEGEGARIIEGSATPLDLYEHVLMAASGKSAGPPALSRALNATPLQVRVIPTCDFLHVGTTAQMLAIAARDPRLTDKASSTRDAVVLASTGRSRLQISRRSRPNWVDACVLRSSVTLKGDNVLVGAEINRPLTLPKGWGLVVIPIRSGRRFVPIAFGDRDDFKTPLSRGGTLGNVPFSLFTARLANPDIIWEAASTSPPESRTLYDAAIWPSVRTRSEAVRAVEWLWKPGARVPRSWESGPRISVADAVRACDQRGLIAHRRSLASRMAVESLEQDGEDSETSGAIRELSPPDAARQLARFTRAAQGEPSPTLRASRLWIASELANIARADHARLQEQALLAVAETVALSVGEARAHEPPTNRGDPILPEQTTWASSPARIDLAGGWSDTPPICHDLGGTVVNAAIRVGGHAAVHAIVRRTERPGIIITSTDLGRSVRIRSIRDLRPPFDPTRWSALACAAVSLNDEGVRAPRSSDELTQRMWKGAGGLHITTFSTLPKGSGLGTSSILGATLLAALADACGERPSLNTLFARTLMLEQRLGTGGGWQDQVGGLAPGVKLLRTCPGLAQIPRRSHLADDLFTDPQGPRPILYFTGVRRMARGILRGVVGRYLARDAATLRMVGALKSGAEAMAEAIRHRDHAEFAVRLSEYSSLKRSIDPGAAHPEIDALVATLERELLAWELPGAGGGGYLLMIARDPDAAARIRRALIRRPLNDQARLAEFSIDPTGLRVLRT